MLKRTFTRFSGRTALALAIGTAITASAQGQVVYNSIPAPLPGNVSSFGPEAYSFTELGDGLNLSGIAGGTLGLVTVVLSSFACQNGHWDLANCATRPGATFSHPITINVYRVIDGVPPAPETPPFATTTQNFDIPYRPSFNPVCGTRGWYSPKDRACYGGIATTITANFSSSHIPIPKRIIVTVAFNTTNYGPHPITTSAPCYSMPAGCAYDSLNIAADTSSAAIRFVGFPFDPDGVFVNYPGTYSICGGPAPPNTLALETGCWMFNHPEIAVVANKNGPPPKGAAPASP